MDEFNGLRIFKGEIREHFDVQFPDGPEPRVLVDLYPHGEWEIPTSWLTEAGYTELETGTVFQVEGPKAHGMLLKSLTRVIPVSGKDNQVN